MAGFLHVCAILFVLFRDRQRIVPLYSGQCAQGGASDRAIKLFATANCGMFIGIAACSKTRKAIVDVSVFDSLDHLGTDDYGINHDCTYYSST